MGWAPSGRTVPDLLWQREESSLRRTLLAPLLPCEALYRCGVFLHRGLFRSGLAERKRLQARVVSVGNLAVGGSGKTPVVAWLAKRLRARGHKAAVLSRGVGGRGGADVHVVSDGERVLLGPGTVGDEPVWLARRLSGIPVLAGHNRLALGLRALAVFGSEVLILDDGFHHHRLERDVDLVCLDARLGLGNGHVLPRGPLRESGRALRRADAIVLTRVSEPSEDAPGLPGQLPAGVPCFRLGIDPVGLRVPGTPGLRPVEDLQGAEVGLLTAIARPDRMLRDLERLGARVVKRRCFRDHHRYRPREIRRLDRSIPWVTTAKDAVKIPDAWLDDLRLWVLEEELRAADGDELVDWLLERLESVRLRG